MKEVASLINERKRKVESIHKIAKWQSIIEGWEVSSGNTTEGRELNYREGWEVSYGNTIPGRETRSDRTRDRLGGGL